MSAAVRVYLPATLPLLARWRDSECVPVGMVFAVTPAARAALPEADEEELEYLAAQEAGEACLRLLADDPHAPRLRVLLAGDVAVAPVRDPDAPATAVWADGTMPLRRFVSLHVDDADAVPAVTAAVAVLDDPQRLDEALDQLAEFDLLWFDSSELDAVLRLGASVEGPQG